MHATLVVLAVLACSLLACRKETSSATSASVPLAHGIATKTATKAVAPAASASLGMGGAVQAALSVATAEPSASALAPAWSLSSARSAHGTELATGREPCPAEMSRIGRTCIDKWEAHLVVVGSDGRDVVHSPYERPQQGVTYVARSAAGVVPQAYISRDEATAACSAASKRLCTLAEWYRACTGPKRHRYPYGSQLRADVCNAGKPHLLSKVHGNKPKMWKYDEHFNDPSLNQQPGFLARTGEYQQCVSDDAVYDMVGNLHEWISDAVDPSIEGQIPLRDDIRDKLKKRAGNAIFMGGFYSTTNEHGTGCAFITIGHEARYHDYSTGFRCCRTVHATAPVNPAKTTSADH